MGLRRGAAVQSFVPEGPCLLGFFRPGEPAREHLARINWRRETNRNPTLSLLWINILSRTSAHSRGTPRRTRVMSLILPAKYQSEATKPQGAEAKIASAIKAPPTSPAATTGPHPGPRHPTRAAVRPPRAAIRGSRAPYRTAGHAPPRHAAPGPAHETPEIPAIARSAMPPLSRRSAN